MNTKKKFIILGCASLVFILIVFVLLKTHASPNPQPSPTASSSNLQNDLPNDVHFNQTLTNINEQYPWYSKLPIENKNYRIVYDFGKNMFRIRILLTTISSSDINTFTQGALNDLKKIGVKEPIKYYVLDANNNQL